MEYICDHIPLTIGKRPGYKITPEYLTIHSTANPSSTAKNERDWLLNPTNTRTASWHICVDENRALEAIPLTEMAYHAGTDKGNKSSIGIEMCESGSREKVIANTVNLAARMLHERNWGIDRLKRHYDWSGKNCPQILNIGGKWQGWEDFKTAVAVALAGLVNEEEMKNMTVYNTIGDLPEYARPHIQLLLEHKIWYGEPNGDLNIKEYELKSLIAAARVVQMVIEKAGD